jgi:hypothetical protein
VLGLPCGVRRTYRVVVIGLPVFWAGVLDFLAGFAVGMIFFAWLAVNRGWM